MRVRRTSRRVSGERNSALPVHYNLGLALEMKGDRLAALDEIEKARELAPNNSSIAEAYERMWRKAGSHGTI